MKKKICSNKRCIHKGKSQPRKDFYLNKQAKDGLCHNCKNCSKIEVKNWLKKHPEKISIYNKLCKEWRKNNPEKKKQADKKYREEHSKSVKNKQRQWYLENSKRCLEKSAKLWKEAKKVVLNYYGNKCIECGERNIQILDINHKNGGGIKHVKSLGGGARSLYKNIIKNNFPSEYNILCVNHNWAEHLEKAFKISFLNKKTFPEWLLTIKNKQKKRNWKYKYKLIEHYSNGEMKCALCPEDDSRVLTIDHITPVFITKEKRKPYCQLIKENFPPGYRILCRNCQRLKLREWQQKTQPKDKLRCQYTR